MATAGINIAVIDISTPWLYKQDPTDTGISSGWYADSYDDSAWRPIKAKSTLEAQGIVYAGWSWYRKHITIPATPVHADAAISLADFTDDTTYWNGVKIGGIKGQYKYLNVQDRIYYVPNSAIRVGANTIAIRMWSGPLQGTFGNGLINGAYAITMDPRRLKARPAGGDVSTEKLVELYDFSSAQRGVPFELVLRINPAVLSSTSIAYAIIDFYGNIIKTGSGTAVIAADGPQVVISIEAATASAIYLAGRFKVQWQFIPPEWTDTGDRITFHDSPTTIATQAVYKKTFAAGTVAMPPAFAGMYLTIIPDVTVNISNLIVYDPSSLTGWTIEPNLQAGSRIFNNRTYVALTVPPRYAGAKYIRGANNTNAVTVDPVITFTIDKPTTVYMAFDIRSPFPWIRSVSCDRLTFAERDNLVLPALPTTFDNTPYGNLKLVDFIDCSTSLATETHPYLQSQFTHASAAMTPGYPVNVAVSTILGKQARSITGPPGFFSYRIGAGTLTVGKTYLLRVEYPEDVPRYCPMEIQAGDNYYDFGWRNGLAPGDPYDPWPLSNQWQFFDAFFALGAQTLNASCPNDGDARNGVWVMFLDERKPNFQWCIYSGGPAIASLRLYEVDPVTNAPAIAALPGGTPQRTMTFDWEHQTMMIPDDVINYGKLMGYSAVSPTTGIKWGTDNWAEPTPGYHANGTDTQHYWGKNAYTIGSNVAPAAFPSLNGTSQHIKFLNATKSLGLDYIPRFEYGGSLDLPDAAKSIAADGNIAPPDRFAPAYGANLLNSSTYTDMKAYLDTFILPYMADHPQFKGALWRVRQDRMQISFGHDDAVLFSTDTSTSLPGGFASYTPAQIGAWCLTQYPAYEDWWHGKRAAFHAQVVTLLQTYRSTFQLYYYNWDGDKWCLLETDLNAGAFNTKIVALGGPAAYAQDRAARAANTPSQYTNVLHFGNFAGSIIHANGAPVTRPDDPNWADYGIRPELYASIPGIHIFCPITYSCYAFNEYINYFQTSAGLAVTHIPPYDEWSAKAPHSKYEGSEIVAGGAPFSMVTEVLAWFYGDAQTLSFTSYTYGRGFADAHRRFAQAFRALPAIAGSIVSSGDPDVAIRTYTVGASTYIGVAHKGFVAKDLTINIPGSWPTFVAITDLVTNHKTIAAGGSALSLKITAGPMELNSFIVVSSAVGPIAGPFSLTVDGASFNLTVEGTITAANLRVK